MRKYFLAVAIVFAIAAAVASQASDTWLSAQSTTGTGPVPTSTPVPTAIPTPLPPLPTPTPTRSEQLDEILLRVDILDTKVDSLLSGNADLNAVMTQWVISQPSAEEWQVWLDDWTAYLASAAGADVSLTEFIVFAQDWFEARDEIVPGEGGNVIINVNQ